MQRAEVLETAQRIIDGPRREAYGQDVMASFDVIAAGWAVILGTPVTPHQVALAMVWLKVCREVNKHQDDNLVDICGYAALAAETLPQEQVTA